MSESTRTEPTSHEAKKASVIKILTMVNELPERQQELLVAMVEGFKLGYNANPAHTAKAS